MANKKLRYEKNVPRKVNTPILSEPIIYKEPRYAAREDPSLLEHGEDMDVVKDNVGDSHSVTKFEDQKNGQEASNVGQFSALTPEQMQDMLS